MAINWSNPRLNALPCERMRGCTFAEDFVTWTRAQVNLASGYGSTFVMDHGLTTEEATLSFPTYPATPHDDQFTVVLQFNTSATSTAGTLAATGDFASNEDGFYIRVTATGVTATFYGNSTQETPLTVACDYADGETHTVTYVVDMTGNSHTLYVDDLDAATGATTVDETIGEDQPLGFGLYFEGEITKARTFGAVLTEEEHDVYHAGTVTSFLDMPWAVWRCDANSDNDAGALILDRTLNHRDLTKGDGATAATYPTWDSTNEKYEFDGVDDYVSGITTLPTAYTLSALKSTDAAPLPAIDQDTDSTYWDLITTTGDYTGYLHSLAIHNSTLTTIQKNHDEYQHLYWTRRKRAYGIIQRLIAEGVCQLCVMLDSSFDDPFDDLSQNEIAGTDTLVTGYGLDGCRFESATSNITYSDEANLRSDQGTIVFFGDFPSLGVDCHLLDKGTNYKFSITDTASFGYLNFQAQTYAYTPANNSMIAITFKDGEPVRYFIDGEYEGDSAGNVAITDSGTTDLVIGNNNET
ncbi:MAG: LamG domain-containing protein, partial [bacterium]|nr:LamG domain-containing protein [bacterium]